MWPKRQSNQLLPKSELFEGDQFLIELVMMNQSDCIQSDFGGFHKGLLMPWAGQGGQEVEENQLVSLEKKLHVEVVCSQRNL